LQPEGLSKFTPLSYLGMVAKASFGMLLPSRAQLELFSIVADVVRIINENAGEQQEKLRREGSES
jgi:hypothetical protein